MIQAKRMALLLSYEPSISL